MYRLLAGLALLGLAACSSLNLQTASRLRALDYINDDIASLVLAFDLPRGLQPEEGGSVLSFDVATATGGEKHLNAVLVRADADEIAGTLPPPATNRVYFLFGFSDKDKTALREMQSWARALPADSSGAVKVALAPRFCSIAPVDLAKANVSVLIALPGESSLAPLIDNQKLADALAGSELGSC
ncbi:MAG TPA: hypothetical protein VG757_09975 [Devosia sp.]|nr:hypothetical protein [Devosia sp.]